MVRLPSLRGDGPVKTVAERAPGRYSRPPRAAPRRSRHAGRARHGRARPGGEGARVLAAGRRAGTPVRPLRRGAHQRPRRRDARARRRSSRSVIKYKPVLLTFSGDKANDGKAEQFERVARHEAPTTAPASPTSPAPATTTAQQPAPGRNRGLFGLDPWRPLDVYKATSRPTGTTRWGDAAPYPGIAGRRDRQATRRAPLRLLHRRRQRALDLPRQLLLVADRV